MSTYPTCLQSQKNHQQQMFIFGIHRTTPFNLCIFVNLNCTDFVSIYDKWTKIQNDGPLAQ